VAPWGTGSIRERRAGTWELRVAVATDPVTRRTIQRSFTFRGNRGAPVPRRMSVAKLLRDDQIERRTQRVSLGVTEHRSRLFTP
jgi:hypothetical protein